MGTFGLGLAALAFVDTLAMTRDYGVSLKSAGAVYLFSPLLIMIVTSIF